MSEAAAKKTPKLRYVKLGSEGIAVKPDTGDLKTDMQTVAMCGLDENFASHLVRACNSFDEILERLIVMTAIAKAVIKDFDDGGAYHSLPGFGGKTISENVHESLAVIAKAGGKQ